MFLRRLELVNVRGLPEATIDFSGPDGKVRKWTLLLGENGVGKSTILKSVALLVAGSEAMPPLLGDPDRWIRRGESQAVIRADLETADGEPRHIEITLVRGKNVREIFSENAKAMDLLDAALSHSTRNYFTVGYGASRRLSSSGSGPSMKQFNEGPTNSRSLSVASLFNADAALNPLDVWAMDLDYRRKDGLRTVRNSLADLLPGIKLSHIDREKRELIFETPDGELPLAALSDGYQNVAAWCGDLLYRITTAFDDYKNPLHVRGLLILDEIDLHLHPVWQRKLREFIDNKLPNMQVLATTHSPMTAQQSGEGELFHIQRKNGGPPVIEQFQGAPNRMYLHQLVASPMFGIETLASRELEQQREEYDKLNTLPSPNPKQKKRLKAVKADLEALPDLTPNALQVPDSELVRDVLNFLTKK